NQKVPRITFKRGIRKEVIHVRVVLQPRMFNLGGTEVQQFFQYREGFLFAADLNLYEIADLKDKAADLMQKQAVLLFNRAADQNRLLPAAEKSLEFFYPLLRF